MEIEVVSDHVEEETGELGKLSLKLPENSVKSSLKGLRKKLEDWLILRKAERAVQGVVDEQFGKRLVRIRGLEVRRGSIFITLAVFVAISKFVKEYPDLRKGFFLIVADVKKAGDQVERTILRRRRGRIIDVVAEASRVLQTKPIVAGFVTDMIGTNLLGYLWFATLSKGQTTAVAQGVLAMIELGMTGVGGFVAGLIARRAPVINSAAEGVLALATGLLAVTGLIPRDLPAAATVFVSLGFIPVAAVGGLLASRTKT